MQGGIYIYALWYISFRFALEKIYAYSSGTLHWRLRREEQRWHCKFLGSKIRKFVFFFMGGGPLILCKNGTKSVLHSKGEKRQRLAKCGHKGSAFEGCIVAFFTRPFVANALPICMRRLFSPKRVLPSAEGRNKASGATTWWRKNSAKLYFQKEQTIFKRMGGTAFWFG